MGGRGLPFLRCGSVSCGGQSSCGAGGAGRRMCRCIGSGRFVCCNSRNWSASSSAERANERAAASNLCRRACWRIARVVGGAAARRRWVRPPLWARVWKERAAAVAAAAQATLIGGNGAAGWRRGSPACGRGRRADAYIGARGQPAGGERQARPGVHISSLSSPPDPPSLSSSGSSTSLPAFFRDIADAGELFALPCALDGALPDFGDGGFPDFLSNSVVG